jgi:hypothetical protein
MPGRVSLSGWQGRFHRSPDGDYSGGDVGTAEAGSSPAGDGDCECFRVKAITTAAVGGLIGADHLEDTGMIAFVSGASRSSPARGDDPIARGWRVS